MFLQRSAVAAARRAAVAPALRRTFATSMIRRESARPAAIARLDSAIGTLRHRTQLAGWRQGAHAFASPCSALHWAASITGLYMADTT